MGIENTPGINPDGSGFNPPDERDALRDRLRDVKRKQEAGEGVWVLVWYSTYDGVPEQEVLGVFQTQEHARSQGIAERTAGRKGTYHAQWFEVANEAGAE